MLSKNLKLRKNCPILLIPKGVLCSHTQYNKFLTDQLPAETTKSHTREYLNFSNNDTTRHKIVHTILGSDWLRKHMHLKYELNLRTCEHSHCTYMQKVP